jgi:hypothetical protein
VNRNPKFWLGLLVIALVGFGLQQAVSPASAVITGVSPSQTVNVGSNATIFFNAEDDIGDPTSQVTANIPPFGGPGTFVGGTFAASTGGVACTGTVSGDLLTVTFSATCINGIDSPDSTAQNRQGSVTLTCNSTGTVTVNIRQNDPLATPTFVICGSTTAGATVTPTTCEQFICTLVAVTANPNVLPCNGGSTIITANSNPSRPGTETPTHIWLFQTTAGTLTQPPGVTLGGSTIKLTLAPGQGATATVTASTINERDGTVVSGTVNVTENCSTFASVVITADPNVIPCAGKSTLTATVRDAQGHVVPGVGFHFTTNHGGLIVGPPNTAAIENGVAVLTMTNEIGSDATVHVTVGTTQGDVSGDVTVQQVCPAETNMPGSMVLTASSSTVNCGDVIFIGAVVRDAKGKIAADGTDVTFVSTTGQFGIPATSSSGGSSSGTPTPIPQVTASTISASTKNGAANVIYTADPNFVGTVKITAASGTAFTPITIRANCGAGAVQGGNNSPGTGAALGPGTVAGFVGPGGAVTPAGSRITPPNTGNAGLVLETE